MLTITMEAVVELVQLEEQQHLLQVQHQVLQQEQVEPVFHLQLQVHLSQKLAEVAVAVLGVLNQL